MTRLRLCSLADLPDKAAVRFEIEGARLAVARVGDTVFAIGDRCSHADYSLSEGDLYADELELECPKHGSTFSLKTGEPQCLPATAPVPVYPTAVEGDDVFVELP
ncbi:MAG: 3-phenylpropionate/trans-cinnamate dioxygenase ferredoxin component [Actinomycetota bacterium]|jgi:3-phenylpropionate/trans-cinnamate dioxygenase ferredoxin subunit